MNGQLTRRGQAPPSAKRVGSASLSTSTSAPALNSPPAPEWLVTWSVSEPVPVPPDAILGSLTLFREAMAPSTPVQLVEALLPLLDLYGRPDGWDLKARVYTALLEDVPPDLLAWGVWAAMRATQFFPRPSEIREQIAEELSRRNQVCQRLETAALFGRMRGARHLQRSA